MTSQSATFAVKNEQGLYLADPFHHSTWTPELRAAKQFLVLANAHKAATKHDADIVYLILTDGGPVETK